MLHERIGQRVYDYDTQEYTHGQFRVAFKYLQELIYNTWVLGALGGAVAGCAFLGPQLGIVTGLVVALLGKTIFRNKGSNKSFKDINNEFFNDYSSQQKAIQSVENRYAMK
jgi:hypothetical protein